MSTVLSPSERLAISREGLRAALKSNSSSSVGRKIPRDGDSLPAWLATLKSIPGADVMIDAGMAWWAQHPFRTACLVAAEAAKTIVQPMAKRHPLGLILVAALVGGVLVKTRPWRWLLTPALFAGLMPRLLSRAVAKMPVRSWLVVLTSLIQAQQKSGRPDAP